MSRVDVNATGSTKIYEGGIIHVHGNYFVVTWINLYILHILHKSLPATCIHMRIISCLKRKKVIFSSNRLTICPDCLRAKSHFVYFSFCILPFFHDIRYWNFSNQQRSKGDREGVIFCNRKQDQALNL